MRHVEMHCENHPEMTYHCKSIAVNRNGRYNGSRTLFTGEWFDKGIKECDCKASALITSDMADLENAKLEE